jgi:hypothetical protein
MGKKTSEQLRDRLQAELNIDLTGARFQSLNPGRWQKSAGAWSWVFSGPAVEIGSPDTVAQCLAAEELAWGPHGTIYAD